jgi:putative Holliday junction resolvase
MLATPVATVKRGDGDVARIASEARDSDAIEVVVGLPISLAGTDTPSTADARGFALLIARAIDTPVRLVDERLTTVSAQQALRASGKNARNSRAFIDQVAAVIILQHALDFERSGGTPPGVIVDPDEGP